MCLKTRGQLFWVPDLLYLFKQCLSPVVSVLKCSETLTPLASGDPLGSASHRMAGMLELWLQLQYWAFPKDSEDPTQVKAARHPPLPAEPPHQHGFVLR